jgi:hypothetical protein
VTSVRKQRWNATTESYQDQQLRAINYNGNGILVNRVDARAPMPGEPLINHRRWLYTYDEEDRLATILFQRWEGGEWMDARRQLYSYQADGFLEEQLAQRWLDDAWQNERRRLLTYDSEYQELSTVLGQIWSATESAWVNTKRMQYTYTANGLPTSEVTQSWDAVADTWVNDNRQFFTMGAQGQFEGRLRQVWEEDSWQNQFRGIVTFANRNLNVLFDAWQAEGAEWEPHSRHQLQYNTDDLPTLSQGWQRWNAAQEEWLNLATTRRYRYFWSELVSSVLEPEAPKACQVANPYPLGTPIACENLSREVPVQLELFDLLGRPLLQRTLDRYTQLTIDQPLPAGVYVLRIRQQDRLVHLQQLVIAN